MVRLASCIFSLESQTAHLAELLQFVVRLTIVPKHHSLFAEKKTDWSLFWLNPQIHDLKMFTWKCAIQVVLLWILDYPTHSQSIWICSIDGASQNKYWLNAVSSYNSQSARTHMPSLDVCVSVFSRFSTPNLFVGACSTRPKLCAEQEAKLTKTSIQPCASKRPYQPNFTVEVVRFASVSLYVCA